MSKRHSGRLQHFNNTEASADKVWIVAKELWKETSNADIWAVDEAKAYLPEKSPCIITVFLILFNRRSIESDKLLCFGLF